MMGGQGGEEEAGKKMRRMTFIFDSMSTEELDSDGSLFRSPPIASTSKQVSTNSSTPAGGLLQPQDLIPQEPNKRVLRVAKGSGTSVYEVEELLSQHLMVSKMAKSMGGKSGLLSKMQQSQSRPGSSLSRAGAGGMPGMPALGPNGMPDFSKMSPSQLSQISKMMPPGMMPPGGMEGLAEMMKSMGGGLGSMMGMG